MFSNKVQEHGKFIFNGTDKKRKQPDSNVLTESVVALLSVTQKYRQNLKTLEDEFNDIKKEEAEIHSNFRRQLLQNQKRLNEFKNSETAKRNAYSSEYQKNLEELNKKYRNQLKDMTVCTKCYNSVIPKSNICIGCHEPLCKNCQDDVVTWGCRHINSNIRTSHMDIDNNKNNMLTSTMKIHDTQVNNLKNLICCKDCITSILTKRCEKCFRRLCQNNKNHSICHICFDKRNMNSDNKNNIKQRDILLCDTCKEAIRKYQKNDKKFKNYTYINDDFLFYTCANPSCHTCLCKTCTEKEGAICHKCGDIYCSQCQKKNTFIKIIMNDSSEESSQQQSYWECLSCIKESQMKKIMPINDNSEQNKEGKINIEEKVDKMNTDDKDSSNNNQNLSSISKTTISLVNDGNNDIQQLNDSNITVTETTSLMDINTNKNDNNTVSEKEANTSNSTIVIESTTTSESINLNSNNNNNETIQGSGNIVSKEIKKIDTLSEELVNFNNKENIPLHRNNTKKKIKEIEAKLNSSSRVKYFNKIMKIRPELKSYQQGLINSHNKNISNENNENNSTMTGKDQSTNEKNEIMIIDKGNNTSKNENVPIKPLEKALSNVTLE